MLRRKLALKLVTEKRHHILPGQFPSTVKRKEKLTAMGIGHVNIPAKTQPD